MHTLEEDTHDQNPRSGNTKDFYDQRCRIDMKRPCWASLTNEGNDSVLLKACKREVDSKRLLSLMKVLLRATKPVTEMSRH